MYAQGVPTRGRTCGNGYVTTLRRSPLVTNPSGHQPLCPAATNPTAESPATPGDGDQSRLSGHRPRTLASFPTCSHGRSAQPRKRHTECHLWKLQPQPGAKNRMCVTKGVPSRRLQVSSAGPGKRLQRQIIINRRIPGAPQRIAVPAINLPARCLPHVLTPCRRPRRGRSAAAGAITACRQSCQACPTPAGSARRTCRQTGPWRRPAPARAAAALGRCSEPAGTSLPKTGRVAMASIVASL